MDMSGTQSLFVSRACAAKNPVLNINVKQDKKKFKFNTKIMEKYRNINTKDKRHEKYTATAKAYQSIQEK